MEIQDRVFYQIFTQSFNKKSIKGIIEKLDYLKELGIKGIWTTPCFESPSYHGYDATDYMAIKKEYGTMEDFECFVAEAHKRDICVIIDWALNHTSNEHEWFIKSSNHDEKYRDYYIWSDYNPNTDITPMNQNPWNYLNGSYYYSSFWSGMPNLNYDNYTVREEMIKVAKFWLSKGIDGFRMDAVKWTYFNQDKCVDFWRWFSEEMRKIKPDIYLVGEAWDSIDVFYEYEKELGSCFNFELQADIIDKINNGNLRQLGINFENNYNKYYKNNGEIHNSIFLSNHDQPRSSNELQQNKKNMEIAATLLFTLNGTPYIYYGEEIGMLGDMTHGDIGVRKDMMWEAVDIEQHIESSLLNFYKRLIEIRNNEVALRKGDFINVETNDDRCLMFKRVYESEEITVVIGVNDYRIDFNVNEYNVLFDGKEFGNEILIVKKNG